MPADGSGSEVAVSVTFAVDVPCFQLAVSVTCAVDVPCFPLACFQALLLRQQTLFVTDATNEIAARLPPDTLARNLQTRGRATRLWQEALGLRMLRLHLMAHLTERSG